MYKKQQQQQQQQEWGYKTGTSAILTHGHTGQLHGGPTSIGIPMLIYAQNLILIIGSPTLTFKYPAN